MKAFRTLLLAVVTFALLGATAYGAGYAVRHFDDGTTSVRTPWSSAPSPSTTASPSTAPDPAPAPEPEPEPPTNVLDPGAKGEQVRELQARLFQLAWWPELTTGRYDGATREAVRGFQAKRGIRANGVVDPTTWRRLVRMTETPTHDQMHNILHPGPRLHGRGDSGEDVRAIQHRLIQIQWLFGDVTGTYDAATVTAVRGFQEKRSIPVTGEVDQRSLDRLVEMTAAPTYDQMHNIEPEPGALDPGCTTGRALCVDKATNSLSWVVDGKVITTLDVRFGSDELPTREGAFTVTSKSRDHVSSLYDTSMPFAMFFSGGQAVHYSPDFAANGYNGASHGCVNVRDYDTMVGLFDQVNVGDRVIVYWS